METMSGVISHRRRSKSSYRCRKPPTRFFLTAQMRSERASRERANFSESRTYISMTCAMMAFRDCSRRALASLKWQVCPVTGHGRASSAIPIFAKLETNMLVGNGSLSSRAERVVELSLRRLDSKADSVPIRLSPTATSGSVRPCSWTFTSVAIFGSHNRSQSSSDFSLTMRPVPATWRRLAGATGSFAPIVRRRESRPLRKSSWRLALPQVPP